MPSALLSKDRRRIVKFALARRWPMIAGQGEVAEESALLSYGADRSALHRRAAYYVDQILKGAKPGNLPIEQPTKFELVVNLRTAKALGLTLSQPFLLRAQGDRVSQRREFLVLGGAWLSLLVAPLASLAQQQGKVWRVGFLSQNTRPASLADGPAPGAFLRGMRELGYVEGKNLAIEWRFADNKPERLPDLAADLVNLKVDLIVTVGMLPSLAPQKATTTIPVVMMGISDPVGRGLIKSPARPGGTSPGSRPSLVTSVPSSSNCCSTWSPSSHA